MAEKEAKAVQEARPDQLANTVEMACARLCVSRSAFYDMLKAGEVRAVKFGTRTVIPETELVGLIQRKLSEAA